MACKKIKSVNNNQESQLYKDMYDKITKDEETLDKYYALIQSESFFRQFGNWVEDYKKDPDYKDINQDHIDDNGEPKLLYDNRAKKYYFIDKYNTKMFFPFDNNGLENVFSENSIKEMAHILAMDFIIPRIKSDFSEIDLDFQEGSLKDFITQKLNDKISYFRNSSNFQHKFRAGLLNKSLVHIDDWIQRVEDDFAQYDLTYVEDETTSIEENESSEDADLFRQSSFNINSRNKITSSIKLKLSILTKPELDPHFDEATYVPLNEVLGTLQHTLSDKIALQGEDLFDIYKEEISNLQEKKPYFKTLSSQLESIDEEHKAEFVQAFNLDRNEFIGTIVDKKGEITYTVQNLSNVGDKSRFVKNNWYVNFVDNFGNEDRQMDDQSVIKLESLKEKFDKYGTRLSQLNKEDNISNEQLAKTIDAFKNVFEELGIISSQEGFNHFLDNNKLMPVSNKEKITNLTSLVEDISYFFDQAIEAKLEIKGNIFDTQGAFTKLAQANAFFMEDGSSASIFASGKTKWVYSYPSYLSTKIKSWKKNRELLKDHYNSSPYNQGSYYMRWLLALDEPSIDRVSTSKKRIDNFSLVVFNSLQEDLKGTEAVDATGMNEVDAIADIFNKMLSFKGKNKSYINTVAPADKSTQYQFEVDNDLMVDTNAREINDQVVINGKATKIIYNYLRSSFYRIKQTQKEIDQAGENIEELTQHYHLGNKNGLKFQLFPGLNQENFNYDELGFELYEDGKIRDLELQKAENIQDISDLPSDSIELKLINYIQKEIGNKIKGTENFLAVTGLISKEGNTVTNNFLDNSIWNKYKNTNNPSLKVAGDIFINGLISQVEFSKMFTGDVAYYKNMEDYKKRVPGTYTDGLQLYLKPGEDFFNAAIISSVEIPVPNYEMFKESFGEDIAKLYKDVNTADAQAWITPERWKFLKKGLGQWKKNIDDTIYDKIIGENNIPLTNDELKRVAQPLKGVYFEINKGIPTYLKYSQAVLIPSLVEQNPGLKRMFDKMTKDNKGKTLPYDEQIHELITNDGIKVGSNNPTTIHNEDGTIKNDFTLNPIVLLNSGWKLQQDLPTKGVKDTDAGSQLQINIYSGLSHNLTEMFNIGGQDMNGKETISYLNKIVYHLGEIGLNNFKNELGVDSDYNINNIEGFYNMMITALKKRGANDNVVKAMEALTTPFGIPGIQERVQNLFASLVRNKIAKIQTNGGSFIQTSSIGMNDKEASNNGVIWTPWSSDKIHQPNIVKDKNGKEIANPGGVMISGSFIAKYLPNYRDILKEENGIEKLFGTKENNYTDGLIDSRILRNVIGYRIPNQALASNDALEIVGILPEAVGDELIPYIGTTTKTGSDFDIDKMFFMLPSFKTPRTKSKELRNYALTTLKGETLEETNNNILDVIDSINLSEDSEIEDIDVNRFSKILFSNTDLDVRNELIDYFIETILNSNTEISNNIKESIPNWESIEGLTYIEDNGNSLDKLTKQQLNNKLIETYKGILLNPNVLRETMTPIDYPFMKDDINQLYEKEDKGTFDNFDILNDIQLRYDFLAGQMGVGMTANMLKDHIRGTMSKLGVAKLGIGDINLDSEYSEKLSNKEIEDYLKRTDKNYTKKDIEQIKIAHSLSAILNAFVDIAKDAYITRGNWNGITSNVGMTLIRAGVHPFKVNAILGQPILKEYVEYAKISESKVIGNKLPLIKDFVNYKRIQYAKENYTDTFLESNITIDKLYNELGDNIDNYSSNRIEDIFGELPTQEELDRIGFIIEDINKQFVLKENIVDISGKSLSQLTNNIGKEANTPFQVNILSNFIKWNEIAREVGDNIRASKQDTYAYGKNNMALITRNNLINKMLYNPKLFKGFSSKLIYENEPSLLGSRTENTVNDILRVMNKNPDLFLITNPNITSTFNAISRGIYNENLTNDKLADKINKSYYSFLMSGFSPFKLTNKEKDSLLNDLPLEIKKEQEKLRSKDKENLFLDNLQIEIGDNGKPYITMNNKHKDNKLQSDIISAWKDLMRSNKGLSDNLVKYSFVTSGFQMNKDQFFTFIPYEWFIENNINEYIDTVAFEYNSGTSDIEFMDQFFRHNYRDSSIVRPIYNNMIEDMGIKDFIGFITKEGIPIREFYKKTNKDDSIFLYKLRGYNSNGQGVYTRTAALGYKDTKGNRSHEYGRGEEIMLTSYPENTIKNMMKKGEDKRDVFNKFIDPDYIPKSTIENEELEENTIKVEEDLSIDLVDLEGNTYPPNTPIIEYASDVGPIRYIENSKGELVMLKDNINQSTEQLNLFNNIEDNWENDNNDPFLNCD